MPRSCAGPRQRLSPLRVMNPHVRDVWYLPGIQGLAVRAFRANAKMDSSLACLVNGALRVPAVPRSCAGPCQRLSPPRVTDPPGLDMRDVWYLPGVQGKAVRALQASAETSYLGETEMKGGCGVMRERS